MLKQTHAKDHDLGNQSISFPTLALSVGGLSVCDMIPIKVDLIVPGKTVQRGVVQKQIIAPLLICQQWKVNIVHCCSCTCPEKYHQRKGGRKVFDEGEVIAYIVIQLCMHCKNSTGAIIGIYA